MIERAQIKKMESIISNGYNQYELREEEIAICPFCNYECKMPKAGVFPSSIRDACKHFRHRKGNAAIFML